MVSSHHGDVLVVGGRNYLRNVHAGPVGPSSFARALLPTNDTRHEHRVQLPPHQFNGLDHRLVGANQDHRFRIGRGDF